MKFCGLNPTGSLAVTTATTVLLLNASPTEARRRGGKNNNASGLNKGLFGQGDLKFFLNSNNNGNSQKPSFDEFNPTFSDQCKPTTDNINSATNTIKCGCPKSVTGMGRAFFQGYVFDKEKMECVELISGSPFQGRSLNFFTSHQECFGSCLVPERVVIKSGMNSENSDSCAPSENQNPSNDQKCGCAPSTRGMQRGYFPGFIYNLEDNKCVKLISGGYHGRTINWFTSENSCKSACVIEEEPEEEITLKFGFGFGGGNSDIEPEYDCLGEAQFPGLCRAMMTRFSFNSGKCQAQLYGGCGGYTTNSFPTIELCQQTCIAAQESESSTDDDQEEVREALFPRVIEKPEPELTLVSTFNQEEGFFLDDFLQTYSEEFQDDINIIFGCSDENPCACPKNVGRNGFGAKERKWYFSSTANRCLDFDYKGFGGNQNRFNSEADCNSKCVDASSSDESNTGEGSNNSLKIVDASSCHDRYLGDMVHSCRAMVFRWSYNSVNNQCEKVIWGGCASFFGQALEDSKNNFATEGECKQTCKFESIIHGNGDRYTQRASNPAANSVSTNENSSNNNVANSKKYTAEPRCQESFNEAEGNGINNVYFIYDNTKAEPRCRRVTYTKPVIWFNKSANLFPRFIDCRRACQPELFAAKKGGRSLRY